MRLLLNLIIFALIIIFCLLLFQCITKDSRVIPNCFINNIGLEEVEEIKDEESLMTHCYYLTNT